MLYLYEHTVESIMQYTILYTTYNIGFKYDICNTCIYTYMYIHIDIDICSEPPPGNTSAPDYTSEPGQKSLVTTWLALCTLETAHLLDIMEGSLEVKLPTIWTDGKAEVGRVRGEAKK